MKKFIVAITLFSFIACNQEEKKTVENTGADSTKNISYAYPIEYSAQFEMSDPAKGQAVATIWKDFDNNTLDNSKDWFADTIDMNFPGMQMTGTRDSMIAIMKSYRGGFAAVNSSIDAIMSTKSTDKDKDGHWVAIWGKEQKKGLEGSIDSTRLHEIWHFNKDGKIDYISQYKQAYPGKS